MLIGGILSTTISIHALLAECDQIKDIGDFFKVNFNPRTPCGVRLGFADGTPIEMGNFNPRTPCGVRRVRTDIRAGWYQISIHALLAECDIFKFVLKNAKTHFNPRTPCGVRPA